MLTNMVSVSDVTDDVEYADTLGVVRRECSHHGTVRSVSIPRAGCCWQGAQREFWVGEVLLICRMTAGVCGVFLA